MASTLQRSAFTTSRALEYFSVRELTTQTGLGPDHWPLMIVKELCDNGLDACESAGIAPHLEICINEEALEVSDNGPGLPLDVLERQLDFSTRTSTNSRYVSPTRGQQGNAIKSILAAPFVVDGESARIDVATPNYAVTIRVAVDRIRDEPVLQMEPSGETVKTGTHWCVHWPGISSTNVRSQLAEFLPSLAACNPHMTIGEKGRTSFEASDPSFMKWVPTNPTSPHWYDVEDLSSLVVANLAAGRDLSLRDLVREFSGLSSTTKSKQVIERAGLQRLRLADLADERGVDRARLERLLTAMQDAAAPIKPLRLGPIGRSHAEAAVISLGGAADTVRYKRLAGTYAGVPYILEAVFTYSPLASERVLITGVNWTPTYRDPFVEIGVAEDSLSSLLADHYCASDEPVIVFVHLICPKLRFNDRGKTTLNLEGPVGDALEQTVLSVVKDWDRQRQRELRKKRSELNRHEQLARRSKRNVDWLEAMESVMPAAYARTAGTTGMAEARQLMYAARPYLQELTGRQLSDQYFSYTLLPRFQQKFPEITSDWNVVYDQRGHLEEPHTGRSVPLSTVGVRGYLNNLHAEVPRLHTGVPVLCTEVPTIGPCGRYRRIIFSEKEGMLPLLSRAQLPERYDLALMTTKGNTVTAARELMDRLTAHVAESNEELHLIVLHDFDVTGLTILSTFLKDTDRYKYQNRLQVIDAGLRLQQAIELQLQDETVVFPSTTRGKTKAPKVDTLRGNSATEEEIAFLLGDGRQGRRVELNALSSDQFVRLVEQTLIAHGLSEKVIPQSAVLRRTYHDMVAAHRLNAVVRRAVLQAETLVDELPVPASLQRRLRRLLTDNPTWSWDRALSELARADIEQVQ